MHKDKVNEFTNQQSIELVKEYSIDHIERCLHYDLHPNDHLKNVYDTSKQVNISGHIQRF